MKSVELYQTYSLGTELYVCLGTKEKLLADNETANKGEKYFSFKKDYMAFCYQQDKDLSFNVSGKELYTAENYIDYMLLCYRDLYMFYHITEEDFLTKCVNSENLEMPPIYKLQKKDIGITKEQVHLWYVKNHLAGQLQSYVDIKEWIKIDENVALSKDTYALFQKAKEHYAEAFFSYIYYTKLNMNYIVRQDGFVYVCLADGCILAKMKDSLSKVEKVKNIAKAFSEFQYNCKKKPDTLPLDKTFKAITSYAEL